MKRGFKKKLWILIAFLLFMIVSVSLYKYYRKCTDLPTCKPFVSANAFRALADHCFDQPVKWKILLMGESFSPSQVRERSIIFIKSDAYYLNRFFTEIHPKVPVKYILLSQNGDEGVPGTWARYLEDDKLLAWLGCNVIDTSHPKMIPLPIGVVGRLNKKLPKDCNQVWERVLDDLRQELIQKDKLLYLNFDVKNNPKERAQALQAFQEKPFCVKTFPIPYEEYLREMASYQFVVSPHGTGLDCYRTWEALALGCIPLVKTSSLDCLYEDLPVLIVEDWSEVTEEFLIGKQREMSNRSYQMQKLRMDYWVDVVESYRIGNEGVIDEKSKVDTLYAPRS